MARPVSVQPLGVARREIGDPDSAHKTDELVCIFDGWPLRFVSTDREGSDARMTLGVERPVQSPEQNGYQHLVCTSGPCESEPTVSSRTARSSSTTSPSSSARTRVRARSKPRVSSPRRCCRRSRRPLSTRTSEELAETLSTRVIDVEYEVSTGVFRPRVIDRLARTPLDGIKACQSLEHGERTGG